MTIAHTKDHLRTLSRETTVFDLSSRALNSKPHDRETPHMPAEITMPQLSDTMTEGTLVKWVKKEGEKVKAGEVVAEIETDKATMEMETSEAGTLAVLVAKPGDKVKVGGVIAALATGKDDAAEVKKKYAAGGGAAAAAPAASKPAAQPVAAA